MKRPPVTRRNFLKGSAAIGLFPFLESLLPATAHAATAAPRRFIAMQSYSGYLASTWYPSAGSGYRLRKDVFPTETVKNDGTVYLPNRLPGTPYSIAPLTDFTTPTGISQILGPYLNPYISKLNLIRGLDFTIQGGHNFGGYFGNRAGCQDSRINTADKQMPTIDRVLAYSRAFYSSAPALRVLDVGTGSSSSFAYTNYGVAGGKVEQVQFFLNPQEAWKAAFGSFMAPSQKVNPNVSLMGAIHQDYSRLKGNKRMSASDRQLLDRHMTFLGELETKISQSQTVACSVPAMPRSIPNNWPFHQVSSITDFQDTVRLMAEVAVAAIRCNITRLVTFDVQKGLTDASGMPAASFHCSGGVQGDWHAYAHELDGNESAKANFIAINKWIAREIFGRLVTLLDVPEADGKTFLDNSLVVWGNEIGFQHSNYDVMTITAGGAGGALKTGNYIDYIDWNRKEAYRLANWGVHIPGILHNRLLVTILKAMGLTPTDYETGGRRGYGLQYFLDTYSGWDKMYDLSQIGEALPGLMA